MAGWEQPTVYALLAIAIVAFVTERVVTGRAFRRESARAERQLKANEKFAAAFDRVTKFLE